MPRAAKGGRPVSTEASNAGNRDKSPVPTNLPAKLPNVVDLATAVDGLDCETLAGTLKVLVTHVPDAQRLVPIP